MRTAPQQQRAQRRYTCGKCFISLNVKSLIAKPILVFISCVFHHPSKNYFHNCVCVWVDSWAVCKINQPNLCDVVGFGRLFLAFLCSCFYRIRMLSRVYFVFFFYLPFSFAEILFSSLSHLHSPWLQLSSHWVVWHICLPYIGYAVEWN